ncbi:LysR family transcriptional regulator [Chitiniphilus eburneus]|uniref:LysR family transcriptional regulator n=1 Tax=Chitiniphilus eburneus TaxID=2571148 RepID=A0A4U0Q6A3_9NEIS|nr:LysR family transcriptional regulator [Chitiniphilus eburneus]TJZ76310.1 LysR family transcriptional regulator [Chitiniphilus eburneus]
MAIFVRVVESGSFVRAAERLQISTTAASRLVADLENHLGARLLNRTTRKLSLTEAGQDYHARCVQILADVAEAEGALSHETRRPQGTLRISAPVSLGILHLAPLLSRYRQRYPDVMLHLELADRTVDLVEEGFDLALRIAPRLGENLVARRLCRIRVPISASPDYLARHGMPITPQALADHNCLLYSYAAGGDDWPFGDDGAQKVRVKGNLRANNGDVLCAAARAGEGIIRQPTFLIGEDLRHGRLVRLLQDYGEPELFAWAVYPSRRHVAAKVRSMIDFLAGEWGDPPPWDGWMADGPAAP